MNRSIDVYAYLLKQYEPLTAELIAVETKMDIKFIRNALGIIGRKDGVELKILGCKGRNDGKYRTYLLGSREEPLKVFRSKSSAILLGILDKAGKPLLVKEIVNLSNGVLSDKNARNAIEYLKKRHKNKLKIKKNGRTAWFSYSKPKEVASTFSVKDRGLSSVDLLFAGRIGDAVAKQNLESLM